MHLRGSAICVAALLCATTVASVVDCEVTLSADPAGLQPGDLSTVTATMRSSSYASLELLLPADEHLHLVTREAGAVHLSNGVYLQEHRWVVQAVSSGEVRWQDIKAVVSTSSGTGTVALAPITLTIVPYGKQDESDTPDPLPETAAVRAAPWRGAILAAIAAGLAAVLWYSRVRRATT